MNGAILSKQANSQIIRQMRCGMTEKEIVRVIYEAGIFCCLNLGVKGKKNIS
jgi:hypothetical protein